SDSESIVFQSFSISGTTDFIFKGLFAEDDSSDSNEDWDADSSLRIEYQVDGGAWTPVLQFEASVDATNQEPAEDTNFDGTGDGTPLTSAFTEFAKPFSASGSMMTIAVRFEKFDSGDEDVALDYLRVEEDVPTTLWSEDFETDGSGTRYTPSEECTDNSADFFTRTDGSTIGSFMSYSSPHNTYFWAASDTDGSPCTMDPQSIVFQSFDISGYNNLVFKGLFAEDDSSDSNEDWDADASVRVEYQVDGGAWTPVLQFETSVDATNQEPAEDTNFDGTGDGTPLTPTFAEFVKPFSASGSMMTIAIHFENLDAGDEDIALDYLRIEEGAPNANALSIEKTVSPMVDVVAGDLVTYTVMVSSTGGEETVAITDTLPAQVDFSHWIQQSGAAVVSDVVTFNGMVSSTQPVAIVFAATNLATAGTVNNVAEYVGANGADSAEAAYSIKPDLVINEINADPDASAGDANGDGTIDSSADEFIEIVNISSGPIDLSNWTLADGAQLRHTFPANSIVPANCAIVIFGNGTPTGVFGNAIVQTSSSGQVGLNNGGDTITLNNGTSDVIVEVYGSNAGSNQSITRDPDITGTAFVQHIGATGSGGSLFSPGTHIDGSQFAGCPVPSLSFGKQVAPASNVAANDLVTYTLALNSIGAAETVNITDTLPSDVDFAYWIQQSGAAVSNDVVTFSGVVSSTQPVTVSFAATNLATMGAVQNTAQFASATESGSADATYILKVDLVINEIHADPDGTNGDANGDGTVDSSADEFVEIVNFSNDIIDLSNWTLSDGGSERHVFPAGSLVPPSCAIVVFGGGSPTGTFGNALVQTATTGSIGLSNGGDSIILKNGGVDILTASYTSPTDDNQSLTLDPDITGTGYITHGMATGSGGALFSPGTRIDGTPFCNGIISIPTIQGSGNASPLDGAVVTTVGVVVADFQDDGLNGFSLQDALGDGNAATSDGIFVYEGGITTTLAVGDIVTVTGEVEERFGNTQITNLSSVVVGSNSPLSPTQVTLPLDDTQREQLEGMLIKIDQELSVTEVYELGRYGQILLSADGRSYQFTHDNAPDPTAYAAHQTAFANNTIKLDDKQSSQNPDPVIFPSPGLSAATPVRGGDTVNQLTGILYYSFGAYLLEPVETVDFVPTNARTAAPAARPDTLSVATMNVLNFFTTLDGSGSVCGPTGTLECRGADSASEFDRQRDKILAALIEMDADVYGLVELQNSADNAALQSLVDGLNAAGTDVYAFIATGAIGTDAISVGYVYKTDTVEPVGAFAVLDSSVDPNFIDTKNRPALAQTFMEKSSGEKFTAAINHFKSKGSDCDSLGDPNLNDGAGNCNVTRQKAAEALATWLATDPTGSGDADYLILGDLNAYRNETPITALEAAGYTDLAEHFIGDKAYSFVFSGEWGYLDYALANSTLLTQVVDSAEWHTNSDEPISLDYNEEFKSVGQISSFYAPDAYRASDHDPMIVHLRLGGIKLFIPVVFQSFTVAPDLVVESITTSGSQATVVVKNIGNGPSTGAFWVDLSVNP
ncbi:MAG: ExeM/NucH family extracellular endonuclease, partial [Candidatus Promineifilaceae bacterium]